MIPELPTIAEAGVPGYQTGSWYGFAAPAGTPRNIIALLNRGTVAAIRSAEISARLIADASLPIASTPESFAADIRDEHARIGKVIREAGIAVESHVLMVTNCEFCCRAPRSARYPMP